MTASRAAFWPLWLLTGLLVIPAAFFWFMSPMGLGFAQWPDGRAGDLLEAVYRFSYFFLNPAMVLAWLAVPFWHVAGLARRGWQILLGVGGALALCVTLILLSL